MAEVVEVALGWDFLGILNGGFLFWDRLKKSPEIGNPGDWDWEFRIPQNLEICITGIDPNLGIFIPGIRDFLKSGYFYPRDWGFFKIWGFISLGIGDFRKSERDQDYRFSKS